MQAALLALEFKVSAAYALVRSDEMFRIFRVFSVVLPREKEIISQVQLILKQQFPEIPDEEVASIPEYLQDPIKYKFRKVLFVADNGQAAIQGFALLSHSPDLNFTFLDYISVKPGLHRGGVGGALYERVRLESRELGALGLFLECLPDTTLCGDSERLSQNAARLKFYERFGARPIIHTDYELPISKKDTCPPFLVFDGLGENRPLRRGTARKIVHAILERKYGDLCPPGYIDRVVNSFKNDPVALRLPRYVKHEAANVDRDVPEDRKIALAITDRHELHHVRERGYVESPARISAILKRLSETGLFHEVPVREYPERHIRKVHDRDFVDYLSRVCANIKPGESIYPYVFPLRNTARRPMELPIRAGYYCFDTFTPIHRNAFESAKRAVDCALTAADSLVSSSRLAYALVRPPGHHAEKRAFGGFCYFNSTAIAGDYLSRFGRVAILDIDYHHGNGTQTIFYDRKDVFTVSIHGHPRFAYPYFSGFEDECGEGVGVGFNLNIPLPEQTDGERFRTHLKSALHKIRKFSPMFLVVALGLDTAKGDPTGTWSLSSKDFEQNGKLIGQLRLPTLVVQEGGYRIRSIGVNAQYFFTGLWKAVFEG